MAKKAGIKRKVLKKKKATSVRSLSIRRAEDVPGHFSHAGAHFTDIHTHFTKIDAHFDKIEKKLEEIHLVMKQMIILLEEQNNRNKVEMDALIDLFNLHEVLEKREITRSPNRRDH